VAGLDFGGAVFADAGHLGEHTVPAHPPRQGAVTNDVLTTLLVGPVLMLYGARGRDSSEFRNGVRGAAFGIGLWNVINGGLNLALRAGTRKG